MTDPEIFLQIGKIKYTSETMKLTELYCPDCGKQKVIVEKGDGGYYSGPIHICQVCRSIFHLS